MRGHVAFVHRNELMRFVAPFFAMQTPPTHSLTMQRRSSKRAADSAAAASDNSVHVAAAESGNAAAASVPQAKRSKSSATSSAPPCFVTLPVADGATVQAAPMRINAVSHPFPSSDVSEWRSALERDGYLHLSNLLPRSTVIDARGMVLKHLRERGLVRQEKEGGGEEERMKATAVDPTAPTNLLSQSVSHFTPVSQHLCPGDC